MFKIITIGFESSAVELREEKSLTLMLLLDRRVARDFENVKGKRGQIEVKKDIKELLQAPVKVNLAIKLRK